MELKWLPEMQDAVDRIYGRHEAFQQGAGERVVERIRTHALKLTEFPYSGKMVREVGHPRLRELVIPPYRVLYLVTETSIDLLTIVHGALDLSLEE